MSKGLIIALFLIGAASAVIFNNQSDIHTNFVFFSVHAKAWLVFLGLFIGGLVTGVLLGNK
ncbi:MAG: hypothetical protein V1746_06845 [bacterium]